jgi:hypothetical protein
MLAVKHLLLLVLALLAATPAAADSATPSAPIVDVASGVTYQFIGRYDTQRLDHIAGPELDAFMAGSTEPTAFRGKFPPARYAVALYRVIYPSVVPEFDNRPTTASGLVAIPETGVRGAQALPLVSYQHGTVFEKDSVPSNPDASTETRIMVARFAAQGYIVIGADYFGRGQSELADSYLVKRSTQQATHDMLVAARKMLAAQNISTGALFLSGWSQGGWATMAMLQKLEAVGIKVTAAAAASAPVDIFIITNRWMNNPQPVDAVYLPGCTALQLFAQEYYLQQSGLTESAIRPQYLEAARALYVGTMSWEAFYAATPHTLADFLRPEFRAGGKIGATPYWHVLQDNQAYRWTSVTPLRTYYGGHDEVTPAYIGKLPEATQATLGGAATHAIDAGDAADHRAVFLFGVLDQKPWFDSLLPAASER